MKTLNASEIANTLNIKGTYEISVDAPFIVISKRHSKPLSINNIKIRERDNGKTRIVVTSYDKYLVLGEQYNRYEFYEYLTNESKKKLIEYLLK